MKILRVIGSVNPEHGGPINGLVNSSRELVKIGHHVDVVSFVLSREEVQSDHGLSVTQLKASLGEFRFCKELPKWLSENVRKYDIVIVHGLWQFSGIVVRLICTKNRVPFVIFPHGMLDPYFNKISKKKYLKKLIFWLLFERWNLRAASQVLFTSSEELRLASASFPFFSARGSVVDYGSPLPDVNKSNSISKFLKRFSHLEGRKFGLFLSRVHPKKGIDLLIKALPFADKKHGDIHICIAGPYEKDYQRELNSLAKTLNVEDKISWLDMLDGDEKWGAFYSSEYFVLPSHQENFGIVVSEALSCAKPVLITNKVNIHDTITSSGAGFVQDDSLRGVELLLDSWYSLKVDERERMSAAAFRCFSDYFSIESAATSLLKVLDENISSL